MKPFPDADLAGKIGAGKSDLASGAVADVGALCAGKNRERQEETGSQLPYWLLLAVNHIAAAMMTSMGAFLTAMLFGITALVAAIRYRSWSILWKTALCCIPNVVYLMLLLVL